MSEFEECIVNNNLEDIKAALTDNHIYPSVSNCTKDDKVWLWHPNNKKYNISPDGDIIVFETERYVDDLNLYKDLWLTVPPHFIMYLVLKYSNTVAERIYKKGILITDNGSRKYRHPRKSDIHFDGFYKWDDVGDETAPDRRCYRLNLAKDAGFSFMSLTWLDRYIHDLRKIYNEGVSKYSV